MKKIKLYNLEFEAPEELYFPVPDSAQIPGGISILLMDDITTEAVSSIPINQFVQAANQTSSEELVNRLKGDIAWIREYGSLQYLAMIPARDDPVKLKAINECLDNLYQTGKFLESLVEKLNV